MIRFFYLLFLIINLKSHPGRAWGFYGHRKINRMACFTLPAELFGFYKKHIEYLTDHAVDPDKRRYSDKEEAPRHFIDIDMYGDHPFDSVPVYWKDAVAKYTEDSLKLYGIVPWYIVKMQFSLTQAFREKNVDKILYYSANIGHYIGDAHVPLHSTSNYNGQLTNQVGIHGFWESRLPELFGDEYDYFSGRAFYVERIQEFCWSFVRGSHAALDSVLSFEKALNESTDQDLKYSFESRGSSTMKVYSREYAEAYQNMLDGQVERRLRTAIINVGSLWYTAWVNAGSPDLLSLQAQVVSQEFMNQNSLDSVEWKGAEMKNTENGIREE